MFAHLCTESILNCAKLCVIHFVDASIEHYVHCAHTHSRSRAMGCGIMAGKTLYYFLVLPKDETEEITSTHTHTDTPEDERQMSADNGIE